MVSKSRYSDRSLCNRFHNRLSIRSTGAICLCVDGVQHFIHFTSTNCVKPLTNNPTIFSLICGSGGAFYVWVHRKYVMFMRSNKKMNTFLQKKYNFFGLFFHSYSYNRIDSYFGYYLQSIFVSWNFSIDCGFAFISSGNWTIHRR